MNIPSKALVTAILIAQLSHPAKTTPQSSVSKSNNTSTKQSDPWIAIDRYVCQLKATVQKHWRPPQQDRDKQVAVSFSVQKDGKVSELKVASASGLTATDKAAVDVILASAPLPALPDGGPDHLDLLCTFHYKAFSNGIYIAILPSTPSAPVTALPASRPAAPHTFPVEVATLNNEGVKLLNTGEFQAAIEKFKEALKLRSDYTYARDNLAIAYNNMALKATPEKALAYFHASMILSPTNATTLQNLDAIIKHLGYSPKLAADLVKVASICENQHDYKGAVFEYERALAIEKSPETEAKLAACKKLAESQDTDAL